MPHVIPPASFELYIAISQPPTDIMWSEGSDQSGSGLFGARESAGPLFLTLAPPPVAIALVTCMTSFQSQIVPDEMWSKLSSFDTGYIFSSQFVEALKEGMGQLVTASLKDFYSEDEQDEGIVQKALVLLVGFIAFELALTRLVPGPKFEANPTIHGNRPKYVDNGVLCYWITIFTYVGVPSILGENSPWQMADLIIYWRIWIVVLCGFALVFCAFLTWKGINAPSGPDASSSGNLVVDFYWGTELYPRIFGWDVKQMTNCRFGMMLWALIPIAAMAHNYDRNGGVISNAAVVNVVLNLIYVGKFFMWETGYFNSMDIQHDRAGFYICWGCLVWVPSFYQVASGFIAFQCNSDDESFTLPEGDKGGCSMHGDLTDFQMYALALFGFLMIYLNYEADRQRQQCRKQDGRGTIFGSPMRVIRAQYETKTGTRKSTLIHSHLWAHARHLHYIFEILAAVAWCVPMQTSKAVPYFYMGFLTLLLFDRAVRDEQRCKEKYGKYWDEYCRKVPYRVIPGVF